MTDILKRALKLIPVVALLGTALVSAPAHAQATRTWVSGVGDDANPCSRTAPCKTFAGAISKTAAKGEINTLDPGGFGGVTITKSLTINGCMTGTAGVLVSGTNAIVVSAGATDKVTLRCLDIDGLGTSLNAVRVLSAGSVRITDSEIFGFLRNAVDIEPSTTQVKIMAARNFIHDNSGAAVMVSPQNGSTAKATVRNNELVDNGCGVVAAQFGIDPGFNYASNCGVQSSASGIVAAAIVTSTGNTIAENAFTGVFSRGALGVNRIGDNVITNNTTGLQVVDSGVILSWSNNMVGGNNSDGLPTGTITPKAP